MANEPIKEGDEVFLHDGSDPFGSVLRLLAHDRREFVVYVEDAGEFRVPVGAVKAIHEGKVILDSGKLDADLLQAIRRAHDEEHEDQI